MKKKSKLFLILLFTAAVFFQINAAVPASLIKMEYRLYEIEELDNGKKAVMVLEITNYSMAVIKNIIIIPDNYMERFLILQDSLNYEQLKPGEKIIKEIYLNDPEGESNLGIIKFDFIYKDETNKEIKLSVNAEEIKEDLK